VDPDANLKEQLELARSMVESIDQGDEEGALDDATRLAELVLALDTWIKNGGFMPAAWARGQKR
jgi:hypothetical protein